MPTVTVSRTLLKSPPELWAELRGDRLSDAVGEVTVRQTEPECALAWEAAGASGTARLEPAGWGTKVILTAEVEEAVTRHGFWSRRAPVAPAASAAMEARLGALLDTLGADQRKPFARD